MNTKQVVIDCPKTKQRVYTGLAHDDAAFASATLEESAIQCPHCGEVHRWSKKDARLETT